MSATVPVLTLYCPVLAMDLYMIVPLHRLVHGVGSLAVSRHSYVKWSTCFNDGTLVGWCEGARDGGSCSFIVV